MSHSWDQGRASQYGDQFGISFGQQPVENRDAWLAAVREIRAAAPGGGNFEKWLKDRQEVLWSSIYDHLYQRVDDNPQIGQVGADDYYIRRLKDEGYEVMALWDVRCRNLAYETTDPNDPMYWKERYETYRLFYIGGRWLAGRGVKWIELYNEPDRDTSCIDGERFKDDVRIRNQAIKDAYKDESDGYLEALTMAPGISRGWKNEFSYV